MEGTSPTSQESDTITQDSVPLRFIPCFSPIVVRYLPAKFLTRFLCLLGSFYALDAPPTFLSFVIHLAHFIGRVLPLSQQNDSPGLEQLLCTQ